MTKLRTKRISSLDPGDSLGLFLFAKSVRKVRILLAVPVVFLGALLSVSALGLFHESILPALEFLDLGLPGLQRQGIFLFGKIIV